MDNFKLLLEFLFGDQSILYRQFSKVTDHIHRFGTEFEERINNPLNPWFLAKYISFVDHSIQLFLESCSTQPDVTKIKYALLDFDAMLMTIIDGTFSAELPSVIQAAIDQESPTNPSLNPNKRQLAITPDGEPSLKKSPKNSKDKEKGKQVINASIHPAWRLADGETSAEHFVRKIDRRKLPTCNVCLNYHIWGTCHSLCDRAASHLPYAQLSTEDKKATSDFIKAAWEYVKKPPN